MYDFTNVELESETSIFAMPQADSIFVTRALSTAGIEFEAYGWLKITRALLAILYAGLTWQDPSVCEKYKTAKEV